MSTETTLAEVIAAHWTFEITGDGWQCRCGHDLIRNGPALPAQMYPHIAEQVRAWLGERLADVWDEGYEVGFDDAIFDQRGLSTDSDVDEYPHANPHRARAEQIGTP